MTFSNSLISYRGTNSPKNSKKDPKSKNKNKQGTSRKVKMSEDELFLNMLIETFSPKQTESTTMGIGVYSYNFLSKSVLFSSICRIIFATHFVPISKKFRIM